MIATLPVMSVLTRGSHARVNGVNVKAEVARSVADPALDRLRDALGAHIVNVVSREDLESDSFVVEEVGKGLCVSGTLRSSLATSQLTLRRVRIPAWALVVFET